MKKISLKTLGGTAIIATSLTMELVAGTLSQVINPRINNQECISMETNERKEELNITKRQFAIVKDIFGNYTIVFKGKMPSAAYAYGIVNEIRQNYPQYSNTAFMYNTTDNIDMTYYEVELIGEKAKLDYRQYMFVKDYNNQYYLIMDDYLGREESEIIKDVVQKHPELKEVEYSVVKSSEINLEKVEIIYDYQFPKENIMPYRLTEEDFNPNNFIYDRYISSEEIVEDNKNFSISPDDIYIIKATDAYFNGKPMYTLVFTKNISTKYLKDILEKLKSMSEYKDGIIDYEYKETSSDLKSISPYTYVIISKGKIDKLDYGEYKLAKDKNENYYFIVDDETITDEQIKSIIQQIEQKLDKYIEYKTVTSDKINRADLETVTTDYTKTNKTNKKYIHKCDTLSATGILVGSEIISFAKEKKEKKHFK